MLAALATRGRRRSSALEIEAQMGGPWPADRTVAEAVELKFKNHGFETD